MPLGEAQQVPVALVFRDRLLPFTRLRLGLGQLRAQLLVFGLELVIFINVAVDALEPLRRDGRGLLQRRAHDAVEIREESRLAAERPGLVHRLAGGDVALDLPGREGAKAHGRALGRLPQLAAAQHGDAGVDDVLAPGKGREHAHSVVMISRLAEDGAVEIDDRVRRDNDVLRRAGLRDLLRLVQGQFAHGLLRAGARRRALRALCRPDRQIRHAEHLQQLPPARGAGG